MCLRYLAVALVATSLAQEPAPARVDEQAAATWKRVVAAMTLPGQRPAIRAFSLRAQILTRDGVQTNDFDAAYQYLEPHYIRFQIETGRETGRGPGQGDGSYWLREKDRVTVLSGREHKQSRNLVKQMTSVAQNFLALSNPAALELADLTQRERAPDFLPRSMRFRAKRLVWLEFTSKDFDLFRDDDADKDKRYRVLIGLEPKTAEPRMAVIREIAHGPRVAAPVLFDLADYRSVDGYRIPHRVLLHRFIPLSVPALFADKPAQEIWVKGADLTPGLTPESFAPK